MVRKAKRFHGLKKIRVRQSWNKYNLYNLSRIQAQNTRGSATFFQQKWEAKALTRGYHGEQVKEKKWQRMFSRHIPAVVSIEPRDLARQDGSIHAAGRGSGLEAVADSAGTKRTPSLTPYMQMTYWMTERRLDTAIHRALFASSARQARQMVVHGHVKVNGVVLKHPSYLLNPGDMFSVDVERVLWATGTPKYNEEDPRVKFSEAGNLAQTDKENAALENSSRKAKEDEAAIEDIRELDETEIEDETESKGKKHEVPSAEDLKARKEWIKDLFEVNIKAEDISRISAKQKQALRQNRKELQRLMSRAKHISDDEIDVVHAKLDTLVQAIESRTSNKDAAGSTPASPHQKQAQRAKNPDDISTAFSDLYIHDPALSASEDSQRPRLPPAKQESQDHIKSLAAIESIPDDGKSYETPWRPRDYMAPFAFIPRYLEVNHTVCSAVYLRHPVARQGISEIPSPFGLETGNLAFAWYLRRR